MKTSGEKLTKKSTGGATKNHLNGIGYSGSNLEAICFGEGCCTPNGATAFYYKYTIKDHLGNARINFRANGTAVTFLQELHYYPFGMLMEGIGTAQVTNNGYKYNGKELNEDLGLNLSDYGARWYDASLGRWWSVDPLGEKTVNISTYAYVANNPMILIDPTGMFPEGSSSTDAWDNMKIKSQENELRSSMINSVNEKLYGPRTVHILTLKGADKKMVDAAVKTLEKSAAAAGLNVVFNRTSYKSFDIKKMAKTDAVAVVGGSNKETADYILNNIDKGYMSQKHQDEMVDYGKSNPLNNPEKSDSGGGGWGYVIATTTNMGKISVKDGNGNITTSSATQRMGLTSSTDALALSIFHGMGHIAGLGHPGDDFGFMQQAETAGAWGVTKIGQYMTSFNGNLGDAISHTMSTYSTIRNAFQNRFGINSGQP